MGTQRDGGKELEGLGVYWVSVSPLGDASMALLFDHLSHSA